MRIQEEKWGMSEDKSMSYLEGNYNGISTGKGSTKRDVANFIAEEAQVPDRRLG